MLLHPNPSLASEFPAVLRDSSIDTQDSGSDSDELSDEADEEESEAGKSGESDTEDGGALPERQPSERKDTAEEKATRKEFEKSKAETTAAIACAFRENARAPAIDIPFKHNKSSDDFFPPPNDYTPGLNKRLVAGKPRKVSAGMSYVYQKIIPQRYWQTVSGFSKAYAIKKKTGQDINAEKAPEDRQPRYSGKGKQRAFDALWVSPNGLLLFHISLLLMVLNFRRNHADHFSSDPLLRSVLAEIYTRDSWQQTMRCFAHMTLTTSTKTLV
ncbi:hypothetical protein CYMTET_37881 [Cymbomonas tetramitiformis]|uniref:Uncharacterized protein n=1 Tax=Cymbomonas tetramitiformis TaxID=36881 RepID=A0AAE0F5I8_9CHLO|nr:hypothetical protein CYMTET_37881 [Cymbomonas tetramitiformis]